MIELLNKDDIIEDKRTLLRYKVTGKFTVIDSNRQFITAKLMPKLDDFELYANFRKVKHE